MIEGFAAHINQIQDQRERCLKRIEEINRLRKEKKLNPEISKQKAYEVVLKDLSHSLGMFQGKYDAKNGSKQFMFGIYTVIEYLAEQARDKTFANNFIKNMIASETHYNAEGKATISRADEWFKDDVWEELK